MKKPNKETLIEIIGAIILLALIGGIISCNTACPYDPNKNKYLFPLLPNESLSQPQT